jgi:hypothetical protein
VYQNTPSTASTLHRLRSTTSSCFSCHHAARTWPYWRPGPSSQAYLSLHSSETPQRIDLSRPLFTCTNANQAATCTLSITHHIQERPSTGPRTLQSSISPLMSALTTHTNNQFREKRKRKKWKKNSNKWSKAKQKPRKDHLSEKDLGPLRQGQRLDTTEIKS